MSLTDAKRVLQWNVVIEALVAAGVDEETMKLVEFSRSSGDMIHGMMQMIVGSADAKQAKNYVKVEIVGLVAPFERAYVELVRSGGKTSHELREILRDRLSFIRMVLVSRMDELSLEAFRTGTIAGIDEDLATESPDPQPQPEPRDA